jgi:hypothetical protein
MRSNHSSDHFAKLLGGAAFLAAVAASGAAHAQPNEDATKSCVQAYESAQEDRKAEHLLKARDELQACAAPSCPSIVQTDCTNWLGQVVDAVPAVVFSARKGTEEVFDVSVTMDGKPVAAQLDGKPVEVDPGLHTFVFTRNGAAPIEKKTIVASGGKSQLIAVTWAAPVSNVGALPLATTEAPVEKYRPVPPLFYVLGGTAVVGFGTFAIVGLTAESTKSDLEGSCSPKCASSEVSSLKTRFLVADIAVGVGAAAAAGALVAFIARPEVDKPQVGLSSFGLAPVANGAALQCAGWF